MKESGKYRQKSHWCYRRSCARKRERLEREGNPGKAWGRPRCHQMLWSRASTSHSTFKRKKESQNPNKKNAATTFGQPLAVQAARGHLTQGTTLNVTPKDLSRYWIGRDILYYMITQTRLRVWFWDFTLEDAPRCHLDIYLLKGVPAQASEVALLHYTVKRKWWVLEIPLNDGPVL